MEKEIATKIILSKQKYHEDILNNLRTRRNRDQIRENDDAQMKGASTRLKSLPWKDKGYLLSKNQYQENSAIAEFFSENHGKISGIIFGASSKKLKNYLQIGNKFTLNFNLKKDGRIGYLKIEIDEILTPFFFEDKEINNSSFINSTSKILRILKSSRFEGIFFDSSTFKLSIYAI